MKVSIFQELQFKMWNRKKNMAHAEYWKQIKNPILTI